MSLELRRQVLRKITYGMWVLATGADEDLEASSVTWLSQVSFTPPLVAVASKTDSHLTEVIQRHGAFTLHLLAKAQQELAGAFVKPTVCAGGKIGGLTFSRAPVTGMPLLEGFPAWLEARVIAAHAPGDHTIFIAEVVGVGATDASAEPFTLAQAGWSYGG